MANAREIRDRMRSIQDTMKITNAMYMISSSKLRRAKKALAKYRAVFLYPSVHHEPNPSVIFLKCIQNTSVIRMLSIDENTNSPCLCGRHCG